MKFCTPDQNVRNEPQFNAGADKVQNKFHFIGVGHGRDLAVVAIASKKQKAASGEDAAFDSQLGIQNRIPE